MISLGPMTDNRPPICPECDQRMKPVRTIPKLGVLPALLAFYCARCKLAETEEQGPCSIGAAPATPCIDPQWKRVMGRRTPVVSQQQ
jgi:hypothetical protein